MTYEDAKILAFQDDAIKTQMKSLAQHHAESASSRVHAVNTQPRNQQRQRQARAQPTTQPTTTGATQQFQPCYRCGRPHSANVCRAKDWICHGCGKKGHVKKVCRARKQPTAQANNSNPQKHHGGQTQPSSLRPLSTNIPGTSSDTIAEELLNFP